MTLQDQQSVLYDAARAFPPIFFCADLKSKSLSNLVLWQHFPARESNVHFIILNHLQCCFWGNLAKYPNSETTSVAVPGPDLHIWHPRRPPRRLLNMCVIKWTGCSSSSPGVPTPIHRRGPAMCAQRWGSSTWEQITQVFPLIFLVEHMFSEGQGGVEPTGETERADVCVLHETKCTRRKQRFAK